MLNLEFRAKTYSIVVLNIYWFLSRVSGIAVSCNVGIPAEHSLNLSCSTSSPATY